MFLFDGSCWGQKKQENGPGADFTPQSGLAGSQVRALFLQPTGCAKLRSVGCSCYWDLPLPKVMKHLYNKFPKNSLLFVPGCSEDLLKLAHIFRLSQTQIMIREMKHDTSV